MQRILFFFILFISGVASADRTMISSVIENGDLNVVTAWITSESTNSIENSVIPCAGSQCSYGIVLYYENGSSTDFNGRVINVTAGMTWKMANDAFVRQFGKIGGTSWQWNWRPSQWDVCVGAIPTIKGGLATGRPYAVYGSPCTPVPPFSVKCSVSGDAIIDHGPLPISQVNGHSAESYVLLSCNRTAVVTITVVTPEIDMGGGVKSQISVTNGNRVTVSSPVTLKLKSVLSGVKPTVGQHTGSTVVIFNIA